MIGGKNPRCNMTEAPCVKETLITTHFDKLINVVVQEPRLFRILDAVIYANVVVASNFSREPDGSRTMRFVANTEIELPPHEDVLVERKEYTVSTWLRPTSSGVVFDYRRKSTSTVSSSKSSVYPSVVLHSSGVLVHTLTNANGVVVSTMTSSSNVIMNQWINIVVSYDPPYTNLYLDGILVGSRKDTGFQFEASTNVLTVGRSPSTMMVESTSVVTSKTSEFASADTTTEKITLDSVDSLTVGDIVTTNAETDVSGLSASTEYQVLTVNTTAKTIILGTKVDGIPIDLNYEAPVQSSLQGADAATNTMTMSWGSKSYNVNDMITSSSTSDLSGIAPSTEYKVKTVSGNDITLVPGNTANVDVLTTSEVDLMYVAVFGSLGLVLITFIKE
jgi:hypothetical protein